VGWPLKMLVNQDRGKGRSGGFGIFPLTKNAPFLDNEFRKTAFGKGL